MGSPPIWHDPDRFIEIWLSRIFNKNKRKMRAVLGAYQKFSGRSSIIIDNGMTAVVTPFLRDLFPEAKFVHIIRDGRAVSFLSAKRQVEKNRQTSNSYGKKGYPTEFPEILERYALYWNRIVSVFDELKRKEPAAVIEIKYEDFCRNPQAEMEKIAGFIGAGAKPGRRFELNPLSLKNGNDEVFALMEKKEYDLLTRLMAAELSAKGYLS